MPPLLWVTAPVLGHLGPVHPVEQALVLTLAFGPFVVLAVVVWWNRRRHAGSDDHSAEVHGDAHE